MLPHKLIATDRGDGTQGGAATLQRFGMTIGMAIVRGLFELER